MTRDPILLDTSDPLQPIPILQGQATPVVEARVRQFVFSIPAVYESWLGRRTSPHTRRSYDQDVMAFVRGYLRLRWPDDAGQLLRVSVETVQAYRGWLVTRGAAPKTVNRRVSSLSGFYKYLAASAAELRLPVVVPNPAHAQFVPRGATDPVAETKALSVAHARQLITLPAGESVLAYRDRAILRFYVYTGARLTAGSRLAVADVSFDEDGATVRLREKGDRRRTVGLHVAAAQAVREYVERAGLTGGPLFRVQANSRTDALGERGLSPLAMYRLLGKYLAALPHAAREVVRADGRRVRACVYTPHSLRATAATLLLAAGVDIVKVQELLGHRHVTTTQIYDKRRRRTAEGASHDVPV